MRAGAVHHASGVRPSKSLGVRGGLVHTFGGLAGFLGVTFLCWGLYILREAFANPIDAGAAALISGAFIFTLAAMLLFFLSKPRKKPRTTNRNRAADSAARLSVITSIRLAAPRAETNYAIIWRING